MSRHATQCRDTQRKRNRKKNGNQQQQPLYHPETTLIHPELSFTMPEERSIEEEELRVYRALYPRESHAAFRAILNGVRTGQIPDAPTHIPLFHDASLPDSQKARFELCYLRGIFQSWLTTYPLVKEGLSMAKVLSMQPGECAKLHLEYEHDGKLYQSFPRIGAKVARTNIEYYLQILCATTGMFTKWCLIQKLHAITSLFTAELRIRRELRVFRSFIGMLLVISFPL